jgi:hypothetical protein
LHSTLARLLATLALVTAMVAAPPAGGAEGNKTKSRITIKSIDASGASGKVASKREGCEAHRKVTLFVYDDFVSTKVKITESNSNGKWRVRRNLSPGKYFAKVDASKQAGTRCLYDVSKNRRI